MSRIRSKLGTWTYRVAAALPVPVPPQWAPTFLIGCGRSGTTFLVSALNQHPQVLALNEPRHIWRAIDPRTDVWDRAAAARGAEVVFQADDASPRTTQRCRRAFHWRLRLSGKTHLVEKLPINNFRLGWIDAMFPTARYINLVRNGFDVAKSIQHRGAAWFGNSSRKWQALEALLPGYGLQPDDPAVLDDYFHRGLLEWTLSVRCNLDFLQRIEPARQLTIRYEDLVREPEVEFPKVVGHLGLTLTSPVLQRMVAGVARQGSGGSPLPCPRPMPAATLALLEQYDYAVSPLGCR